MIWNRYSYLTSSVQDTKREGRSHLKQRHTIKHYKQKDSFFPKIWPNGYQKHFFQNMHAMTYNDRDTENVIHSRSTALQRSVKLLLGVCVCVRGGGGGGGRGRGVEGNVLNRFYMATTLLISKRWPSELPSYHANQYYSRRLFVFLYFLGKQGFTRQFT